MKLLINTESLAPPITGIGTYTLNLLQELGSSVELEEIECFLGHRFQSVAQALADCTTTTVANPNHSGRDNRWPPGRIKSILRNSKHAYLAREIMRNALFQMHSPRLKKHVYHEPNFILKKHLGPCVATIHDLSFIHYPQHHPAKRVAWLTGQLPATLKRADMLITDSEHVRRELIEQCNVEPDKVRTIHLGAAKQYAPQTAEQTLAVLERYGLKHGSYLLFVGTLEPRKGIDTLLNAWETLPLDLQRRYPLVLAGAAGWNNTELQLQIQRLSERCGLRHLNFVPATDLPQLYAGATLLAYPSLYEGFGLPVLEAMKSGVPVICTTNTSMTEITGDSALLIDAGDVSALREHIAQLLENQEIRERMSRNGLSRAELFSWQRCAAQTLDAYRALS